jgi:hypothetical protein
MQPKKLSDMFILVLMVDDRQAAARATVRLVAF